jgi:hypothetical protein
MVEAHARAVAASVVPRATKGIPGRTMDMITQELVFVLEGSDGAAERCAAMESLFWLQVIEYSRIYNIYYIAEYTINTYNTYRILYILSFLGVLCVVHQGRYSVVFWSVGVGFV